MNKLLSLPSISSTDSGLCYGDILETLEELIIHID